MSFTNQAADAIRSAGGRMTSQRRLVIEALEEAGTTLDAEGLHQHLLQDDESVSLATVYRTLNILEEAGLVNQRYISREHERKVYEPIHIEETYHITCRSCGTVIPFTTDLLEALRSQIEEELGVKVLHQCMCLDGLCSTCKQEQQ